MAQKTLVIADLRGGRNGIDSPVDPSVPANQCAEAVNVDFFDAPLGRKRAGARQLALTGGTAMSTRVAAMFRHVPDGDEDLAELFAVDDADPIALVKRLAGGTTWVDVTRPAVGNTSTPAEIDATSFNGKLFWSENTDFNRLLVIEGSVMRWVGLAPPAGAVSVTNTGSGSYPASLRYYRLRFNKASGNVYSEPTTAAAFTPSGTGLAARIARPTLAGEGETSWIVEGSVDGVNFYRIATVLIATTFYDDTNTPSQYAALFPLSQPIGTFNPLPAGKFLLTDDNRLLVGGTWHEQTDRIYFTPILGSLDQGDDERYVNTATQKNWVSLTSKNGGRLTGMGGPISNGLIYAFKYRQIWRLSPTGEVTAPYLVRKVSNTVGCIRHRTIVMAEDAVGNATLYFLSHKGPYRIGVDGLEYMGRDIEDRWFGKNGLEAVNLTASVVVGHGVYHSELNQIWWWVATGTSYRPTVRLVLDLKQAVRKDAYGVRGGWTIHTGTDATSDAHCSVMFADAVGAVMSTELKPYVGRAEAVKILKCDSTADQADDGTPFRAYVKTRSIMGSSQFGEVLGVKENVLLARTASGVTITQTIDRDFGAELQTSTVSLTPEATETRVLAKFEGSMQSDIGVLQIQLGDSVAVASPAWALDQIALTIDSQGDI